MNSWIKRGAERDRIMPGEPANGIMAADRCMHIDWLKRVTIAVLLA